MSNYHALKQLLASNLCERIGIVSAELSAAYIAATRKGSTENYADVGELYVERCTLEKQLSEVFTPDETSGKDTRKDILLELLIEKEEMTQTEHEHREFVMALLQEKQAELQEEFKNLQAVGDTSDPDETSLLMRMINDQSSKIREHFKRS